jgi:hypothetical protein
MLPLLLRTRRRLSDGFASLEVLHDKQSHLRNAPRKARACGTIVGSSRSLWTWTTNMWMDELDGRLVSMSDLGLEYSDFSDNVEQASVHAIRGHGACSRTNRDLRI